MNHVYGIEYFSGDSNDWYPSFFFSTSEVAIEKAKSLSLSLPDYYDNDYLQVLEYPLDQEIPSDLQFCKSWDIKEGEVIKVYE